MPDLAVPTDKRSGRQDTIKVISQGRDLPAKRVGYVLTTEYQISTVIPCRAVMVTSDALACGRAVLSLGVGVKPAA